MREPKATWAPRVVLKKRRLLGVESAKTIRFQSNVDDNREKQAKKTSNAERRVWFASAWANDVNVKRMKFPQDSSDTLVEGMWLLYNDISMLPRYPLLDFD